MHRRDFLRLGITVAGGSVLGLRLVGGLLPTARAATAPYGPLLAPDANGIMLPSGFTSRVLARTGQAVGTTGYTWHTAPDGGATFPSGEGWVYVSNSEAAPGGAGHLRFDASGAVVGAGRILSGTIANCAGGPTPWGTWLSCEETPLGQVWECSPVGATLALARPALGKFKHEAAAVDSSRGHVYLTEDQQDGRLYRFIPSEPGDLSAGQLQVATVTAGAVTWTAVPDPSAALGAAPTRYQVVTSTAFNGGEGAWYAAGQDALWFTTKGDNRVWRLHCGTQTLTVAYDDNATTPAGILTGVDNVVATKLGDVFVCEDGGDMQLVLLDVDGGVSPFLQITGQPNSELTGPAFDPSRTRLYLSSQRGTDGNGITYEITGPFRDASTPPSTTTTSTTTTTTTPTTTSTTTTSTSTSTTAPPTTTTSKPRGKPTPTTLPGATTTTKPKGPRR